MGNSPRSGLWDEQDGFYYDQIRSGAQLGFQKNSTPLRVRSLVGLLPMLAVEVLEKSVIDRLPGFSKRMQWFLENRQDLAQQISCMHGDEGHDQLLLAIPSRDRLARVLSYLLDENEFLSPYGI